MPRGTYSPGDVTLQRLRFRPVRCIACRCRAEHRTRASRVLKRCGDSRRSDHADGGKIQPDASSWPIDLLSVQMKTATITSQMRRSNGTGVAIQANAEDANSAHRDRLQPREQSGRSPPSMTLCQGMAPSVLAGGLRQYRSAGATVTVTSSTIHATTGDITIDSTVNVNSNAQAGGGYDSTVLKPTSQNPIAVMPRRRWIRPGRGELWQR